MDPHEALAARDRPWDSNDTPALPTSLGAMVGLLRLLRLV